MARGGDEEALRKNELHDGADGNRTSLSQTFACVLHVSHQYAAFALSQDYCVVHLS